MDKNDALYEEAAMLRDFIESPVYKKILNPFLAEQREEALRAAFDEPDEKTMYRFQGRWQALDFIDRWIHGTIERAEKARAKEIAKATRPNKLTEGLA